MSATKATPLYAQPIPQRPPQTSAQKWNGLLCFIAFTTGCVVLHLCQYPLLPLALVPLPPVKRAFTRGIRWSKGAFACLLVLMTQLFAPTELRVTFETDGEGGFTPEEVEKIVVRNQAGLVTHLRLPKKAVIISNHQVYVDWWYTWHLAYLMDTHRDVFIVLKESLKWVPVLGWGMQLFRFVFLARSWESDRRLLARRLAKLGQRAHDEDVPLSFMFFPEGTLVSKDTRPISKKFADKSGIPDMEHTLLPRSTGLQYVLRSLAPRIPDLHLLDLTIAYPGVPPRGYGQSYYTLRSIFFARVPPPAVHIHIRRFRARDTPMGELGPSDAGAVEVEVPTHEKVAFEEWVRGLWRRKDEMIDRFHATGTFAPAGRKDAEVAIPVKLRTAGEYVQAYGGFAPVLAGYALWRLKGQ